MLRAGGIGFRAAGAHGIVSQSADSRAKESSGCWQMRKQETVVVAVVVVDEAHDFSMYMRIL